MKHSIFAAFAAAMSLIACSGNQGDNLVVKTEAGMIRGYEDRGVLAFTNIPYCKYERFMPPQKPDHWKGILDCNTFAPKTMQYMGEDPAAYDSLKVCEQGGTRLNVWTKNRKAKMPVMVWLHGGGFSSGAAYANPNDSGTGFAKQDVVLVSVNHRLNITGFFDLSAYGEKYKYSGNVGMMDIVVALEWVRDNISKFGGDPENVTIFGESGGGGKVGTLMCMPSARGLFHKAIIMSGTLLNGNTQEITQAYAAKTLEKLGIAPEDVDKIADVPYLDLYHAGMEAVKEISGERRPGFKRSWGFAPTIDGDILVQQPFQPTFADFSKDIPIMIGSTFNELEKTYFVENPTLDEARPILEEFYGDKAEEFIEAYPAAHPDYTTPADMLSVDKTFRPYTVATADARSAEEGAAPVYMYLFGWKSPLKDGAIGSCHAYELPFVFHMPEVSAQYLGDDTPEIEALSDKMSHAWVNFAYYGKPEVEGFEWNAYKAPDYSLMYFNDKCEIRNDLDRKIITIMQNR